MDTRTKDSGRSLKDKVIPLILAIAGIAALLYPVVATYLYNAGQSAVVDAYRNSQSEVSVEDRSQWIERAHAYNAVNAGAPILDPWLSRVAKDNRPYQNYVEELNPSGDEDAVMAAISIPAIDVKLPIYHGTEDDTLHKGVGHLYGSALPVGGENTHSILTGHTGLTTATMFDELDQVVLGDAIYIEVMGEALKYEVDQIEVVLPEETSDVQPIMGQDHLTLITCTPYGINSHRLLVRGVRVPMDPEESIDEVFENSSLWQPWMTWVLIGVVAVLLIIAWLILRERRKNQKVGAHRAA
ncbi:class C sortase [Corynebacterium faecale]|uniref:class C sortase n=1 Tax=Corynebacterium faecale TaxID=1758466 RepID=UPI0025B331F3|nr:class C sortase [Corynebacterium faecale]